MGVESFEWCTSTDRGLPKPDIFFYKDSNPLLYPISEYEDERHETQDFQIKVKATFSILLDKEPHVRIPITLLQPYDFVRARIMKYLND